MPIVCLEGPSAVGKTTLAAALAETAGAFVVPEVNLLFERPADEPASWYFERQAERWAMAAKEAADGALVVLDGDVFQPLWYNWAYDFDEWQGLDALEAFYRPRIARGEIGFPGLYVVLGASEDALRTRKAGDATRRRGGFETHLRFISPQRRYFAAMRDQAPELVRFVDADEVDTAAWEVATAAERSSPVARPVELFDHMIGWLREHRADEPGS